MLPFELNQKICASLDFLSVNRFQRAFGLDPSVDKRIVGDKKSNFICPICIHGKLDQIMSDVFKFTNTNTSEFQGMRFVQISNLRDF